ncbi:MAG: glycosyltransferase [Alphaproteobacteria bacterium]|uniref:Glycosyltransferase n=1 Tax=Candidatus Nitrobium versatile TaxID=2884831 RepID=A0A953M2W8_9BACT|nr:glycosyltransferase [Candidatus Nitrobium versatile]
MNESQKIVTAEDYEKYSGAEAVERVARKARPLRDYHIAHINSTYYGGGVAEILSSKSLLMNSLGIRTGWRIIQGSPDFFSITKKMHNALQGDRINLSKRKMEIYESVIYENAVRNHLDHDIVLVHDPQPLPLIDHYRKRGPWIWRCHIDLTRPNRKLWSYLLSFIRKYDAVIFSLKEYARRIPKPQLFFLPAIDPFSIKNRELSEEEIDERLAHYRIPTDLPLVVQVARFDRWKDPEGVIRAFRIARRHVESTLVLLGNVATDDPEGERVFESLLHQQEERILILSHQDSALVNALQRRADVVLQKSLREGFGLTVTEAMWKRTPVIGGNVGGIRHQIEDGVNGFLVSSVGEAADRIVLLLKDKRMRETMGARARETVKQRFLMIRLVEQYLDLFNSFEANYRLVRTPGNSA